MNSSKSSSLSHRDGKDSISADPALVGSNEMNAGSVGCSVTIPGSSYISTPTGCFVNNDGTVRDQAFIGLVILLNCVVQIQGTKTMCVNEIRQLIKLLRL